MYKLGAAKFLGTRYLQACITIQEFISVTSQLVL